MSPKRAAELARRPKLDWSGLDRAQIRAEYVTRAQVRELARQRRRGWDGCRFQMWPEFGSYGALMVQIVSPNGGTPFVLGIERDGYAHS